MVKINDTYYELDLIDIVTELKTQLALNNTFLFNHIKDTNDNLIVTCPFHKNGQEKRPSCGLRKTDGFLHCFTCGANCSLLELISRCFNHNDLGQFGLNWLKNNFLGELSDNRELTINVTRQLNNNSIKYVTENELSKYRYYHPYMYKRKMTDDVIDKFDIGYDRNTNCITFPVRDINGNCLFVARRNVDFKFFNYPNNVEKPIYGIYELNKYGNNINEVIVCESMINAITCWVYGKYAIALNGTGTQYQYELLKKLNCRKFILALDPDEAGNKGRVRFRKALQKYKLITELEIPNGKDINDLSKEEFENLLEIF